MCLLISPGKEPYIRSVTCPLPEPQQECRQAAVAPASTPSRCRVWHWCIPLHQKAWSILRQSLADPRIYRSRHPDISACGRSSHAAQGLRGLCRATLPDAAVASYPLTHSARPPTVAVCLLVRILPDGELAWRPAKQRRRCSGPVPTRGEGPPACFRKRDQSTSRGSSNGLRATAVWRCGSWAPMDQYQICMSARRSASCPFRRI